MRFTQPFLTVEQRSGEENPGHVHSCFDIELMHAQSATGESALDPFGCFAATWRDVDMQLGQGSA